jgi:hypothetical protein
MNSVYDKIWIHAEIVCIRAQAECSVYSLSSDAIRARNAATTSPSKCSRCFKTICCSSSESCGTCHCPVTWERQVASNHGLASIADPVRIPHGVDALDGLRWEVQRERLAGILYGPGPARPLAVLDRLVPVLLPHFRLSYI